MKLSFSITNTGAVKAVMSLSNTTLSQTLTITELIPASGVILVDCVNRIVSIDGAEVSIDALSGSFPELGMAATQTFTIAGLDSWNCTTTVKPRYY
jgi:hypothetical protein